jgi:hypothetical protein
MILAQNTSPEFKSIILWRQNIGIITVKLYFMKYNHFNIVR